MKEISRKKTIEYWKIAGLLNEDPFMTVKEIGYNTVLARSTVTKYLKEMYAQDILIGPWISLKPHSNYREYVHLMKFSDPAHVFGGLKGFPNVLHHEMTSGSWNTLVITDRLLDFSQLKGFESIVYQGVKGFSHTPRTEYSPWNQCFERIYEFLEEFIPSKPELNRAISPSLNWGEDEWKLYHAFRLNVRRRVTPVLGKITVRYETYAKWMKTLNDHCTIHTEFYPEGCNAYMSYCFLLDTDYKKSVISLFSLFPTTPVIMEVDDQLLVFLKVASSVVIRSMFCMIYDMKAVKMIKNASHTIVLHNQKQLWM